MVNALLHIICGNCGRKDFLSFKIDPQGTDRGEEDEQGNSIFEPSCSIYCENCSTVHDLESTIPVRGRKDD